MPQKTLFEFLTWKHCEHESKSRANGGIYCKHPETNKAEYCVRNPGHSIMSFDCPIGRSRIYPLKGF